MEKVPILTPAQTRKRTAHYLLGQPSDLVRNELPCDVDISNYVKMKRLDISLKRPIDSIFKEIAEEVMELWEQKGNIPTMQYYSVFRRVKEVYTRAKLC